MRLLSLSFLFIILACSNQTSKTADTSKLEYGEAPKNYEKVFEEAVKSKIKYPDAAKFQKILDPRETWFSFDEGKTKHHGWALCGEVKEKDSTIFEPHLVFYLNGNSKYIDMAEYAPHDIKLGAYDLFMLITTTELSPDVIQTKDGTPLCPGLDSFRK